jgi:hypothetical protein
MWIMLAQNIASTGRGSAPGQGCASTSSRSGGRTRAWPAHQAWIDGNDAGSKSVGCQSQPGRPVAKWAACWPVPLAISSIKPLAGSSRCSSARMGGALRSAAGLWRRASMSGMRQLYAMPGPDRRPP